MKKLIWILALGGIAVGAEANAEINYSNASSKKVYEINISLDTTSLEPNIVQVAIFDKDPLPELIDTLTRNKVNYRKCLLEGKSRKDTLGIWQALWDECFSKVKGKDIQLLLGDTPAKREMGEFGGICGLWGLLPQPSTKKWVVTKMRTTKTGIPFVWYIPVELKEGKTANVQLTPDNVFDIEKEIRNIICK